MYCVKHVISKYYKILELIVNNNNFINTTILSLFKNLYSNYIQILLIKQDKCKFNDARRSI